MSDGWRSEWRLFLRAPGSLLLLAVLALLAADRCDEWRAARARAASAGAAGLGGGCKELCRQSVRRLIELEAGRIEEGQFGSPRKAHQAILSAGRPLAPVRRGAAGPLYGHAADTGAAVGQHPDASRRSATTPRRPVQPTRRPVRSVVRGDVAAAAVRAGAGLRRARRRSRTWQRCIAGQPRDAAWRSFSVGDWPFVSSHCLRSLPWLPGGGTGDRMARNLVRGLVALGLWLARTGAVSRASG